MAMKLSVHTNTLPKQHCSVIAKIAGQIYYYYYYMLVHVYKAFTAIPTNDDYLPKTYMNKNFQLFTPFYVFLKLIVGKFYS